MKGGVGKTTIAVGVAYELAQSFQKNVLLIDIDPQTNATLMVLGEDMYKEKTVKKLTFSDLIDSPKDLIGEKKTININDIITCNPWKIKNCTMDIIPSSINLFETKNQLTGRLFPEQFIKIHLNQISGNKYDYCIIDTPPDFGKMVVSALIASDYYIIPMKPDYLSQQGIIVLNEKINQISDHLSADFLGIVISMIPTRRSTYSSDTLTDIKKDYASKILEEIKFKIAYSKWPNNHEPLKNKKEREPFVNIARKIIKVGINE